jgi:CHASE2 domain-containing sensor protein
MAEALLPNGVPPDYFKDKIVLIGGQFALGGLMVGRDELTTPY